MSKFKPHSIDVFAGQRVRELRLMKGWTEKQLAKKIGVTFQQLQKYESAANRISASRLYLICKALNITISEFFSELYSRRRKQSKTMKMIESIDAVRLARLFFKMSPRQRQRFYKNGKSLVRKKRNKKGDATVTDKPATTSKTHPVDIYVGKQIWKFRIITNMNQRELAEKIVVGTQQIQKYEEGQTRVSVSRLHLICEAFEITIPEFFADFYRKQKRKGVMEMIETEDGAKLAGIFFKIPVKNCGHFIRLGKSIVEG